MAWIESHQELANHPKTRRLCRLAGIKRRDALGLLHLLWYWVYDYAPEGDLSSFSDDDIADAVDWEEEPEKLVSILITAGFMDENRCIHDWWDYAQKWIERRRKDAERKKSGRASKTSGDTESDGCPPDVHRTSNHSPYVTGPDHTGPDHTGPDRTPTPKSPPHGGGDLAPAAAAAHINGTGESGGKSSRRNGRAVTAVLEPPSPDDEALWALAVEQIAGDGDGPAWQSNVENWIRPLAVAGRGPTGGLQLRAPPYVKQRAQGMRQMIVMALRELGDPQATHVAIVE